MKFQETIFRKLSSGRTIRLDCTCSAVGTELIDFNVFIKEGTFLSESELEECNNLAKEWALDAALCNSEVYYG